MSPSDWVVGDATIVVGVANATCDGILWVVFVFFPALIGRMRRAARAQRCCGRHDRKPWRNARHLTLEPDQTTAPNRDVE
ncbi:hypothetical protein [uncultured Ruegeria sp.]|uniref:hypothetical protein n=1 Tax=uncultured Ruegeria sp. TaxID=259304 RepID=UPI00262C4F01|nr:hypothetical protein [uncultured Ruegeria sp.]